MSKENTEMLKTALNNDLENGFQDQEVENKNTGSCFKIKPLNEWIEAAKKRPIPNMLFSELWYEFEVCILFASTNLGKSILALQIANAISKGITIGGFKMEVTAQKVLYFDFELSDKQIEGRCSNQYSDHYIFSPNLLRVELNLEDEIPPQFKDFEDYLCFSLEKEIIEHNIKIIVIDNISYIKRETEKAKDALPLMKFFNNIKKKYGLSILVLAHSPKRDKSKTITINDLSGSAALGNFIDSSFAIGDSVQETGLRYIKQIKQRNTELKYDTQNVIICKIEKESNFLEFVFVGYESEIEHLKPRDKAEQITEILELKKQGLPNTQIAPKLGISEGTVRNYIKKSENN